MIYSSDRLEVQGEARKKKRIMKSIDIRVIKPNYLDKKIPFKEL